MAPGKHEYMKAKVLQETREEFLPFPLDVFCNHIQHERRKMVEGEWWREYCLQQKLKKKGHQTA
jgi:hypothetical protein